MVEAEDGDQGGDGKKLIFKAAEATEDLAPDTGNQSQSHKITSSKSE